MILLYQLYALGLLRLSGERVDETGTWSFTPPDYPLLLATLSSNDTRKSTQPRESLYKKHRKIKTSDS